MFQSTPAHEGRAITCEGAMLADALVSIHARPRGTGDRRLHRWRVRRVVFQSTPAHEGRAIKTTAWECCIGIGVSIHARPRGTGDRPGCRRQPHFHRCFNPRPPTRDGRLMTSCKTSKPPLFQSTPAHEGRAIADHWIAVEGCLQVSIHARPRGTGDPYQGWGVVIQGRCFNPRPPTRDGRSINTGWIQQQEQCFNPRPPTRDGRSMPILTIADCWRVSIHARPRGTGDHAGCVLLSGRMSFNPRPPTRDGRSAAQVDHAGRLVVSIHARPRGTGDHMRAHKKVVRLDVSIHARPRGTGDRSISLIWLLHRLFQSTPAHEGRAIFLQCRK